MQLKKKMNKETFWNLGRSLLLCAFPAGNGSGTRATASVETWLMSSLLLGHEAAGLLCDGWQDKTNMMPGGINESHLLKTKRKSRWSFIALHLKYLRYKSFYHVSLRMLLA